MDWRGKVGRRRSLSAGEFLVLEHFGGSKSYLRRLSNGSSVVLPMKKGISRASRQSTALFVIPSHLSGLIPIYFPCFAHSGFRVRKSQRPATYELQPFRPQIFTEKHFPHRRPLRQPLLPFTKYHPPEPFFHNGKAERECRFL